MFNKQVLSVALFAIAAQAQTDAEKYPDFAAAMALYGDYTWEAVEFEVGDWNRVLFHITGSNANPGWKPGRQSLLMVGGAANKTTHWLQTASANYWVTKQAYAGARETELLNNINSYAADTQAGVDKMVRLTIQTLKENYPDRYATLASFWKENDIADLDLILETWPEFEYDDCTITAATDAVDQYGIAVEDLGLASNLEYMDQPNKALPINLFDYGFDVWMDGNRGTQYQTDNEVYSSSDAEYWNFNLREMALEDQKANIDYILSTDRNVEAGWEKLSFLGYSMGIRQMYYLMGMAGEGDADAKAIVDKVDKFVALAPCVWNTAEDNVSNEAELTARLQVQESYGVNYIFGDAPWSLTTDVLCDHSWMEDQEAAAEFESICRASLDPYEAKAEVYGAVSLHEVQADAIGQFYQGMAKSFSFDPETGAYPTELIDFAKAVGPDVYQFIGALDQNCDAAIAADPIHAIMPTSVKQYNYDCFDHNTFQDNSVASIQLHKDIVNTLGAEVLAATAVAAVAAFALI